MAVTVDIEADVAFAKFDAIGPRVHDLLVETLRPIASEMAADARSRALAHFHSVGKKPGLYLASITGGVSDKKSRVSGYVRSGSPLAHLLEYGFTISDLVISVAKGSLMAWEAAGVGELYRRTVHRHETTVQSYPAIGPAFDARRGDIAGQLRDVARQAGEA